MGALQELPQDVLVIILFKLARQDTSALLRATFACKELDIAAEQDHEIWRKAFLSPSVSSEFCEKELKCFDAKIQDVGGYKRMLASRAASLARRNTRHEQSA